MRAPKQLTSNMIHRALIKTHHMTSRKKITAIVKAAKKHRCAVYLKTGEHPPGIMIAEAQAEEELKDWIGSVKVGLYVYFSLHLFCIQCDGPIAYASGL